MNQAAPIDPQPILREFLSAESILRVEPLENAGGWSGSLLWRATADAGLRTPRMLCLRRWPEGTTADRLHFIHQVLTHVAACGIDFVPRPLAGLVSHGGHLWDLTTWLPGSADFHANPTRPRLAAAMHALARLHSATATFRSLQPASGPAPAFIDRRDQVRQLLAGQLDRITAACRVAIDPELDWRADLLLSRSRDLLPHLLTPLEVASRESLPFCPAIRDVHHDHVLFREDHVTGLIDFGAMRIDTPLADVARLVGSLAGDDAPARAYALDAYSQLRTLTAQNRLLIDLLDQTGLVVGSLNWLNWLYVERRDMGPLPPILKRLDELLVRLQHR